MSRKSKRNRPEPTPPTLPPSRFGRTGVRVASVVALLIAIGAGWLLYQRETSPATTAAATTQAALASAHSPTLGDASAKVHVVEFLDPACETCAQFFPLMKQALAENPGRIRLSVRHVAFHTGSDYVVRLLEASRAQDKYWQTLDALLTSQARWAPGHTAQPELVGLAIAGVGLNLEQLLADMNAPDVAQRIEQDRNDAIALKVIATPEYFVNGRPLPSFGEQPLLNLVREELQRAY
jgi:protein-disulfide isomerase